MLLEMHNHTSRHSGCSVIDPVTLLRKVMRKGLQGIILTEHHFLWPEPEIAQLRAEAGVEKNFLILAAQEVDTEIGHVLVYGAGETIPGRTSLAGLRQRFPSAALVWAHPFRGGRIPSAESLRNPLLDGIEIISLNHSMKENVLALNRWHELKFTAISGSDTHSGEMAGVFPTQFDHPVSRIDDVVLEIRHSRCRPFIKEIPKAGSDLLVTELTIGTKGDDELRNRVIVKRMADRGRWRKAERSIAIVEELRRRGFSDSPYRVPRIIDAQENEMLVIEEGQRGKSLFDVLSAVQQESGRRYFEGAAVWLARLHNLRLQMTPRQETAETERARFARYEESFAATANPFAGDARRLIAAVRKFEEELFRGAGKGFVQNHGDYHPKNIIIGQDRMHDPGTMFVSVIDFNSSLVFPPAFDVAYFLAQFKNQFIDSPAVTGTYDEGAFIDAYLSHADRQYDDFQRQIRRFKMRANLSIASFLIKIGKGTSRDMERVIADSLSLLE